MLPTVVAPPKSKVKTPKSYAEALFPFAHVPVGRTPLDINAADLFCGAGGTSSGLLEAAMEVGFDMTLAAVNHWAIAISTHKKNHPEVFHCDSDLERVDPEMIVQSGYLRILVASPECTHYSNAAGGRPKNKQSRATPKWILKWASRLYIEDILIENVKEFRTWGPLYRTHSGECDGDHTLPKNKKSKAFKAKWPIVSACHFQKPIKSRQGQYFKDFIRKLRNLGYQVEHRVICMADYGDPTTRQRLFIIARKSKPVVWPTPTHHKTGKTLHGQYQKWRTFEEDVWDRSVKGESIYTREARGKKPLAPTTMKRIEEGLRRFVLQPFLLGQQSGAAPRSSRSPVPTVASQGAISFCQPFLIPFKTERDGQKGRVHSSQAPIPTVHAGGKGFGIAEPVLIQFNGTSERALKKTALSIKEPIPSVTGSSHFAIAQPFLIATDHTGRNDSGVRSGKQPVATLTSNPSFGVVEPYLVEYHGNGKVFSSKEPVRTQTSKGRFALVEPTVVEYEGKLYVLDILFRMLTLKELARTASFGDDYKFEGTKEDAVKQIGNAVPKKTARALCRALLS